MTTRAEPGQRQTDTVRHHAHLVQGPFHRNRVGFDKQRLVQRHQAVVDRASGFGIATLPRAAVDSLASRHDIAALDTVLKLKPLPVVASYLNLPANSELEETISAALRFAKASMQTAGKSRPDSQALVAPKDGLSET